MIATMPDPLLYFTNNGLHTHLILPSQGLKTLVPQLSKYFLDEPWLQLGWGDFGYYGSAKQTKLLGFRALFMPTKAIIGVRSIRDLTNDFPQRTRIYAIPLPKAAMDATLLFISRYFQFDESDDLTVVRKKANGELFFSANGTYSILNTCNNWTAYALREAGLKISPKWTMAQIFATTPAAAASCATSALASRRPSLKMVDNGEPVWDCRRKQTSRFFTFFSLHA